MAELLYWFALNCTGVTNKVQVHLLKYCSILNLMLLCTSTSLHFSGDIVLFTPLRLSNFLADLGFIHCLKSPIYTPKGGHSPVYATLGVGHVPQHAVSVVVAALEVMSTGKESLVSQ